jgi:hypothetical protein
MELEIARSFAYSSFPTVLAVLAPVWSLENHSPTNTSVNIMLTVKAVTAQTASSHPGADHSQTRDGRPSISSIDLLVACILFSPMRGLSSVSFPHYGWP